MVADLWCLEITAFYVVLPLSLFYNPFCSISLPIPPPLPDLPPYSPHSTFSHIPFPLPPPSPFFIISLDYSLVSERSHSPPLRKRKGRALTLIAGVDFEWTECSN